MRFCAFLMTAALLTPAAAMAGPKFNSSTAKADHGAANVFDGLLSTSWAEDAAGQGLGSWVEVDLGKDVAVETLSIWGGSFGGKEEWSGKGRLAEATLLLKGPDGEVTKSIEIGDRYARKDVRVDTTIRSLRITVDEVHEGAIFAETHIAEVAFDFAAEADPAWQAAIDKNLSRSKSTRGLAEAWPAELQAAYDLCRDNNEYRDNFKLIAAAAARGPEYLVTQVQKAVPVGHRLKMLQWNEDAVDFLGRLKDANAIPSLEVAAAGATNGDDRQWLMESVLFFRAYQDLRSSRRGTVPNWGSTGLEKGAFRGRGESLALAADSVGNLWVSDPGNNRVQRLTQQGTADVVIGHPEEGIVDVWFGDKGDPYASASKAGKGPTEFIQPFDLDVGNYDILAVVDASLRVRTFDAENKPMAQWRIESSKKPNAGAGVGSPIVTWLGDEFFFIVRDEVFVYNATGELQRRFTLEGGAVQCAIIAAGGKLLVRHTGERTITEYKAEDGFRQGTWIKKGVPDDGSEDWDMATDEKDAVYVVTDAGMIYVWNKRGKFVKQYTAWENPRDLPRLAVWSNVIYVSSAKNEVTRVEMEE